MMESMAYYLTLAVSAVACIGIVAIVSLKGFNNWLDLKKAELALASPRAVAAPASTTGNRIELADLRERVRQLEAIAAGVDL